MPFAPRAALPAPRFAGALLGAAIGDALAMPIAGMSHQNVRMYYKGIKGFVADEKRGTPAGVGTALTARLIKVARALSVGTPEALAPDDAPRATAHAAAVAVPLAALPDASLAALRPWLERLSAHPAAQAAAAAHVHALRALGATTPDAFAPAAYWADLTATTREAEAALGADGRLTARLDALAGRLHLFPLDLQDLCGGTGDAPDEAWPFAAVMLARNARLVEPTLLSAINVGGDAPAVGALLGALLGALHCPRGFPDAWRTGLAARADLEAAAHL